MSLRRIAVTLVSLALLASPSVAAAQFTVFTNQASFLSQLSNVATDNFNDLPADNNVGPLTRSVGPYSYRATATVGGVFFGGPLGSPSGLLSVNTATSSILFDNISPAVRGFGGFFFGSDNGIRTNITLNIVALNADGSVTQTQVNPAFSSYVGFVSTKAIQSVTVQRVSGDFATADNVQLGVLASVSNVVPEPSTYALMATGLLVLGLTARRRRSR